MKAPATAAKVATAKPPRRQAAVATGRRQKPAKASASSALTDTAHHERSYGASRQEGALRASVAQLSADGDQQVCSTASQHLHHQRPPSASQPETSSSHSKEQRQALAGMPSICVPNNEVSSSTCESTDPATDATESRSRRDSEACSIAASVYSSSGVPPEQQKSGQSSRPPMKQVTHWCCHMSLHCAAVAELKPTVI